MAIKDANNPGYEDMWKGENGEQEELKREHQRLLYVAMTRSCDHLVMLATLADSGTPVKQNTWLDYLHQTLPLTRAQEGSADQRIRQYAYPSWEEQFVAIAQDPAHLPGDDQHAAAASESETVLRNLGPCPRSSSPEWKRATDLLSEDREEASAVPSVPSVVRSVSPLVRGNVMHRCLEEHARTGAYVLENIIPEFPDLLALDPSVRVPFEQDLRRVLDAVVRDPKLAWVFERNDTSYSELPFLYTKGHAIISGIIDRVVIRNGQGFVIDYKSNPLGSEDAVAGLKEHYRPQIVAYCETVKEIFRLDRVEGHLLFLDSARLERVV
jgi:ATP-dependent exoDNAse (exonuclease V) beta subunit